MTQEDGAGGSTPFGLRQPAAAFHPTACCWNRFRLGRSHLKVDFILFNLSQSGDSFGLNAHATYLLLTCCDRVEKEGGKPVAGISVDQWAAELVGQNSLLPSMQLGYSGGETTYFFDRNGRSGSVERDPKKHEDHRP